MATEAEWIYSKTDKSFSDYIKDTSMYITLVENRDKLHQKIEYNLRTKAKITKSAIEDIEARLLYDIKIANMERSQLLLPLFPSINAIKQFQTLTQYNVDGTKRTIGFYNSAHMPHVAPGLYSSDANAWTNLSYATTSMLERDFGAPIVQHQKVVIYDLKRVFASILLDEFNNVISNNRNISCFIIVLICLC